MPRAKHDSSEAENNAKILGASFSVLMCMVKGEFEGVWMVESLIQNCQNIPLEY